MGQRETDMDHKYMSYTCDSAGIVTRNHRELLSSDITDISNYKRHEALRGWPELCVYWHSLADGSAAGIAPMTDGALKAIERHNGQVAKGMKKS